MTREEFCHLMITLLEKTGPGIDAYLASKGLPAKMPFADTNDAAIAAAYVLGIVNGTSATTFNPNGFITRQESAAMLSRTAKVLGVAPSSAYELMHETDFPILKVGSRIVTSKAKFIQ